MMKASICSSPSYWMAVQALKISLLNESTCFLLIRKESPISLVVSPPIEEILELSTKNG